MLGLKLNHVSKRGHRKSETMKGNSNYSPEILTWKFDSNITVTALRPSLYVRTRVPLNVWCRSYTKQTLHAGRHRYIYIVANLAGTFFISWWRHQMKTFSALLALCAGHSPVTGEFPSQRGALMFSLSYTWTNGWVNNRNAGDLMHHSAHYDVTVMYQSNVTEHQKIELDITVSSHERHDTWNYLQLVSLFNRLPRLKTSKLRITFPLWG